MQIRRSHSGGGVPLPFYRRATKTLRLMKLTAFILLTTCLQVTAGGNAQEITLRVRNVPMEVVFSQIEKQSNYLFWYDKALFKDTKKVNLIVRNANIAKTLNLLFEDQPFTFSIVDNLIAVRKKAPEPLPSILTEIAIPPITIRGKVSNLNGESLEATVLLKGTNIGTKTNADGTFELRNVNVQSPVLVISSVGYQTQELAVGNETNFNVILIASDNKLESVVVVGYGTQKRANVTGAISSIESEEIKNISTSNMITGLAGKLPGFRVTQRTSEPGAFNTLFDIRGYGAPLIVVDGVVMDQGNFARLNPNDIESISVLKDASAAVYGIKAANGVVLVTTKRGTVGKPVISYSGFYQIQKITNAPELSNAYDYATLHVENEINQGVSPTSTMFSPEDIQAFKDGSRPSTDWYGLVARNHSTQKSHHLSVSGGSDRIKYFTSLGFLDEMGIYKSGDLNYKKYNVRSNITGKVTDDLEVELNLDVVQDNQNQLAWDSWFIFTSLYWQDPTKPAYTNNNPDYFVDVPGGLHSIPMTDDAYGYLKTKNKIFQGSFKMNYRVPFVDGLSAKFMYAYYNIDSSQRSWAKKFDMHAYDPVEDKYSVVNTFNAPSTLFNNQTTLQRTSLILQLNYDRVFMQKHNVNASAVFEERHEMRDNLFASKQFAIDVPQFFAGLAQNSVVSSSNIYEFANQNFIGRVNYAYAGKYLFEAGFNYGASSRFPEGKRWGFFPFTSAGWRISEEPFFKNALPSITNLKLRGSWGQMGDDGASTFQFLTGYDYPGPAGVNYVFNGELVAGLGFRGMPNPNITWFTITSKNLGLDVDYKNGLISLSFDVFQRDRSGLLGTRVLTIPGTVGAALPQENLNSDLRRGFDLVVGHAKRTGEFRYQISGNISYSRGRFKYIERAPDANSFLNWKNNGTDRWQNIMWGYNYLGQFQTQEEVYNAPIQDGQGNRTLRPGDLKYEDVNKDGVISDLDQIPIGWGQISNPGYPTPDLTYGFQAAFSYKNFDLNFLVQGAANFNYFYPRQLNYPLRWIGRNPLKMFMDRWHHEDIFDVNSPWVPGYFPSTGYALATAGTPSQFYRPNASYLRLKSAEIGYTLGQPLVKRFGIQNLRVYASGFNLLTFTKLKFVDPEAIPRDGIYPIYRIFNFGVNVSF